MKNLFKVLLVGCLFISSLVLAGNKDKNEFKKTEIVERVKALEDSIETILESVIAVEGNVENVSETVTNIETAVEVVETVAENASTTALEALALAAAAVGQSVITSNDLVGEWTCDAFAKYSVDSLIDDDWTSGPENLFLQCFGGSIIFNDDGNGSFSITCVGQDPFYLITTDETESPTYIVAADTIYRKCYIVIDEETYSTTVSFSIKRINQNIMIFKFETGANFASKVIICQRVLTP